MSKWLKKDSFRTCCNRRKRLQYKTGLNSKYSKECWELIAKEESGV
jgi:hypothetical protein